MTKFGTPRLRGCFFVLLLSLLGDVGKAIKSLFVFCRASLLLLASFLLYGSACTEESYFLFC